mmetsp:Transcript_100731/g.285515  ORF Transcript_100731/g.285515 Transcript_100731/m.285515 type:complete len:246 (-) Transcript_100731:792-1529(-)
MLQGEGARRPVGHLRARGQRPRGRGVSGFPRREPQVHLGGWRGHRHHRHPQGRGHQGGLRRVQRPRLHGVRGHRRARGRLRGHGGWGGRLLRVPEVPDLEALTGFQRQVERHRLRRPEDVPPPQGQGRHGGEPDHHGLPRRGAGGLRGRGGGRRRVGRQAELPVLPGLRLLRPLGQALRGGQHAQGPRLPVLRRGGRGRGPDDTLPALQGEGRPGRLVEALHEERHVLREGLPEVRGEVLFRRGR